MENYKLARLFRKIRIGSLIIGLVGSFGAPSFADTDTEYYTLQGTAVGRRVLLLLSDGNREQAIRLCERECRLKSLGAVEVVDRIEREMREEMATLLPYLEPHELSLLGRVEALRAVPPLAISPDHRSRLFDRLEELRAIAPTDLDLAWAHFRSLLIARRYDAALDLARELEWICERVGREECESADGSFLVYTLHATQARMSGWLSADTLSGVERFEKARPHLELAIEAAERLGFDYLVPQAFEPELPCRQHPPVIEAKFAYALAMLEAGLHQEALSRVEEWLESCPESHSESCHRFWHHALGTLSVFGLRLEVGR